MKKWRTAREVALHSSSCATHYESYLKLLHRWYNTPYKLARMFPGTATERCWRECGGVGTLLHVFWECPLVRPFWAELQTFLREVCSFQICLTPQLTLLRLDTEDIPISCKSLCSHTFNLANSLIGRYWKSKSIPTISETITMLNRNYNMESMVARSRNSVKKFEKQWEIWGVYRAAGLLHR